MPGQPFVFHPTRVTPVMAMLCAIILVFAYPPTPAAAQEGTPPTPPLPAGVRVEGDFLQPRLVVAGQTVLEQAGAHMGYPQISPDGQQVAVALVPTGTETAHLAQLYLFERQSGRLLAQFAGHSPRWNDDRRLLYESAQGRALYDTATQQSILDPQLHIEERLFPSAPTSQPVQYPQTIRVMHHPQNTCRNVPAGQVDVIPFEEYVARSVPAEMPVSWSLEALKAQAIAARTYAWYQIHNGPRYSQTYNVTYDVTDWANTQMMCNQRYARSDLAVALTAGQYLSAQGDPTHAPIIAMYSAKNGHPTLDNPNVAYLRGVPDLTGLGEQRWGHGFGLSQWGAQRRAVAGHNYWQILGHYYSGVHLQNAWELSQPIGGLIGLDPNGYLAHGGLRWHVLGPAAPLSMQTVVSSSGGLTRTVGLSPDATQVITDALVLSGRSGVWRGALQLEDGTPVSVALWLEGIEQEALWLNVDRTPPAPPAFVAPASSEIHTVTLAVTSLADEPIGLSNGWTWQGESLHATNGSSTVVAEAGAEGGAVRLAHPAEHKAGTWYGPYATDIPAQQTYRALFRLRMGSHPAHAADGTGPDRPVARLDVTDQGGALRLGLRDLWASDFPTDGGYVEVPVDFHIFAPVTGLEFRVHWHGEVELALDRVRLFSLKNGGAQNLAWPLSPGLETAVAAVAFDRAGNVSSPVTRTVRLIDETPPTIEAIHWPQGWQTQLPITVTASVQDLGSGLDTQSGVLLVNGAPTPVTFGSPDDPWAQQQMTAVLQTIGEGEHTLRFRLADRLGNVQESAAALLRVDLTRPTVSARTLWLDGSPAAEIDGWLAAPVRVELQGTDAVSGLSALAYVLNDTPFVFYSEPFSVEAEGQHSVRYWAQDNAGNYSVSQFLNFSIDRTPPVVTISILAGSADGVTVGWQAHDAFSGVAWTQVETRRGDGPWQPIAVDVQTMNQATIAYEEAEEVGVRVKAADHAGHESDWLTLTARPFRHQIFLPQTTR